LDRSLDKPLTKRFVARGKTAVRMGEDPIERAIELMAIARASGDQRLEWARLMELMPYIKPRLTAQKVDLQANVTGAITIDLGGGDD
jgi:hypothetical protein